MKIRIIKENNSRKNRIDESFRDIALAAMLGLAGVSNSAEAGVSNVTEETLNIAHAFAKEKVQNSTDIDKTIEYNKALESLEIAKKTPEMEKMSQLNPEAIDLIGAVEAFMKKASPEDKKWAQDLVKTQNSKEIIQKENNLAWYLM